MRLVSKPHHYEYLEHPADIYIRAYGKTTEEAFTNAAHAITSTWIDPTHIKDHKQKKLTIKSPRITALLFDFLSALLVELEANTFLPKEITKLEIIRHGDSYTLHADLIGDDAKKYEYTNAIKAATYHQMVFEFVPHAMHKDNTFTGKHIIEFVMDV